MLAHEGERHFIRAARIEKFDRTRRAKCDALPPVETSQGIARRNLALFLAKGARDEFQQRHRIRTSQNETRRALNELVHRNRERGVPDELLKGKEKELIEGAGALAANRLKTNFILHRIAEAEKVEVTREEIDEAIRTQASHYNVSVEKMRKELEENDRINGLAEEILLGKTLDFLKANVSVEPTSEKAVESAPPP